MSWKIGHFTSDEFKCKCGCGHNKTSPTFLWKLNQARDNAGIAFIVVSGCRCENHNKNEGGKEGSDHLCLPACEGVDVRTKNSWERFKIVNAALQAGFRRIGVAKTFVHLGDRASNPQNVLWKY